MATNRMAVSPIRFSNRSSLAVEFTRCLKDFSTLEQKRNFIACMASYGVIKEKYAPQLVESASPSAVERTHLSMMLTQERLDSAMDIWGKISAENPSPLSAATSPSTLKSKILNIIWDIRDGLLPLLYSKRDIISAKHRSLLTLTLIRQAAKAYSGLSDLAESAEINWSSDGNFANPREAQLVHQALLENQKDLAQKMSQDSLAVIKYLVEKGHYINQRRISPKERDLYVRISETLRKISSGQESAEALAGEINGLIEAYEKTLVLSFYAAVSDRLRPQKKGLTKITNSLREIARDAQAVVQAQKNLEEARKIKDENFNPETNKDFENKKTLLEGAQQEFADAIRESILHINDLLTSNEDKNFLLKIIAGSAIFFSIIFLFYRWYMGIATNAGTGLLKTASLSLVVAETFYNGLAIIYQLGVIRSSAHANGEGYLPLMRKGLDPDKDKRPPYAFVLTMVEESVGAIFENIRSHTRSAWEYGKKCHVLVCDMSSLLFNKIGALAATTLSQKMTARKLIVKSVAISKGISSAKAEELSSVIASQFTEVDDKECRFWCIARVAEIGRKFYLPEARVKELGKKLAKLFEQRNQDKSPLDHLEVPVTLKWITDQLIAMGGQGEKIPLIAELIEKELHSLVRRSSISRVFHLVFCGKNLSLAERKNLENNLCLEFKITPNQAQLLTGEIMENVAQIEKIASEAVGEQDFFSYPSALRLYNGLRAVMGQFMINDKRTALISESLFEKIQKIVQNELYMGKEATRLSLGQGPQVWKNSNEIGTAIAQGIDKLRNYSLMIEDQIKTIPNPSFKDIENAREKAWEEYSRKVKNTVFRIGKKHGLTTKENEKIAKAILENFEENKKVRDLASHEFANQVIKFARAIVQNNQKISDEELLNDLLTNLRIKPTGDQKGGVGLAVSLLLKDMQVAATEAQKKFATQAFDATLDPEKDRQELINKLQGKDKDGKPIPKTELPEGFFPFSQERATEFVDAYIKMYKRQVGLLKELVPSLRSLVMGGPEDSVAGIEGGLISPIQAKRTDGGNIMVGETLIDLEEIKKDIGERIRKVDVDYRGGAKAGVICSAILGGTIPQYIGEQQRWTLHQMIEERIFNRRRVPQQIITRIDTQISGQRGVLPRSLDEKLCDADFIATIIVNALEQGKKTDEILDLLINEKWKLGKDIAPSLLLNLREIIAEINWNLVFGHLINRIGQETSGEKRQRLVSNIPELVEAVAKNRGLSKKEKTLMAKWGEKIKANINQGLFVIAGNGDNYYLRLHENAARNNRVEEALFEHYHETLRSYYQNFIFGSPTAENDIYVQAHNSYIKKYDIQGDESCSAKSLVNIIIELTRAGKGADTILETVQDQWQAQNNKERQAGLKKVVLEVRKRIVLGELLPSIIASPQSEEGFVINLNALKELYGISDPELTILKPEANKIQELIKDIFTSASIGSLKTEIDPHNNRLRITLADKENSVAVARHRQITKELEFYQAHILSPKQPTAEQIAQELIIRGRLPLTTYRREAFASEIQKTAPLLETAYKAVEPQVQEIKKKKEAEGLSTDEALRQTTLEALDLIKAQMENLVKSSGMKNYLNENIPEASTLKYTGFHCDDADYRAHRTAATDQAPYLQERKGLVMTGQRQFGRDRGKPMADAFQSGGNAYWGFTNISASLLGITPSWGSCVSYSSRSYRHSAFWIGAIPYEGTVAKYFGYTGKFQLKKLLNITSDYLYELYINSSFYKEREMVWPLVMGRLAKKIAGAGAFCFDLAYAFSFLIARDSLNYLSSHGFMPGWLPDSITNIIERPIDKKKLLEKSPASGPMELFAIQDCTTESEDIASGIHFFREIRFATELANPWWERWLTSLTRAPEGLWNALFIEGIGSLGAHSDGINSANVTFYARWARGNEAIIWDILSTPMGFSRKLHFAALSLFWNTGLFRPMLILSPMAFMGLGISTVLMGANPLGFLSLLVLCFGFNMTAFLYSMRKRGFFRWDNMKETLACMYLDFGGLNRMLKSFYQGTIWGERPPFEPSPKESVVIEKVPLRKLWMEYGLLAGNATALGYTMLYGFSPQIKQAVALLSQQAADYIPLMGGTPEMLLAGVWTAFHGVLIGTALKKFNKGVYTERPYVGTLKAIWKDLSPGPNTHINKGTNYDNNLLLLKEEGNGGLTYGYLAMPN